MLVTSTHSNNTREMSASNIYSIQIPEGYYVYAYLRESDFSPYYIGKGKGKRAWDTRGRHSGTPKNYNNIIILASNLDEQEALVLERQLIAWYGRKNKGTGILRNLTDGGDGVTGRVYTEEDRRRCSKPGSKNGMYGKTHSDAVKLASSIRRSRTNSCRRWYNNGIDSKFLPQHPGEGWVLGRIKPEPTTLGRKKFTNGVITICAFVKPDGPEWRRGQCKKI